jgi:hypothetical protein
MLSIQDLVPLTEEEGNESEISHESDVVLFVKNTHQKIARNFTNNQRNKGHRYREEDFHSVEL